MLEPVDNTGFYKLAATPGFPGAPVVVLGDNGTHVASREDMFVEALSADGAAVWHRAGMASWTRSLSASGDHLYFGSEYIGKADFDGVKGASAHTGSLVVKLGAGGALAWGHVLETPEFTRMGGVAATPDGGVAVAIGIFLPARTGPLAVPTSGGEDTVIVKYDAAGQPTWSRAFGWAGYDEPRGLFADAGGDVTVVGTRYKSADTNSSALATGHCHGWVTRLDPAGVPRWSTDLGGGWGRVNVSFAAPARDGVVVTGHVRGRQTIGATAFDTKDKEVGYVAGVGADGHVRWARLRDIPGCIAVDRADRLIMAEPKGVSIESPEGASTLVLPFAKDAVNRITECVLDDAGDLWVAGMAAPAATIGDKPLHGPVLKRPGTSWLKPYEVGFVAKIAL